MIHSAVYADCEGIGSQEGLFEAHLRKIDLEFMSVAPKASKLKLYQTYLVLKENCSKFLLMMMSSFPMAFC